MSDRILFPSWTQKLVFSLVATAWKYCTWCSFGEIKFDITLKKSENLYVSMRRKLHFIENYFWASLITVPFCPVYKLVFRQNKAYIDFTFATMSYSYMHQVKWKIQGVPQSQVAANPRCQEEEKKYTKLGITNKYTTNICLRPVWSESSLSTWRNIVSVATQWMHIKDYDQTGRMPRLIWIFAGHKDHFVGFVKWRLVWISSLFPKPCDHNAVYALPIIVNSVNLVWKKKKKKWN